MTTHIKSPNTSATLYNIGIIKQGLDKMKWIVLPAGKSVRWKMLVGKHKIYYTIDNGAKKYKVIIDEKKIIIFILNKENYDYLITIKKYKNIFIGKSSKKFSPYNGIFMGNSLLIENSINKYTFIGTKIYQFITTEPIVLFQSPMSNSSVVYPFAISKNHIYLMLEYKYINKSDCDNNTFPYTLYYNLNKQYNIQSYNFNKIIISS